MGFEDFEKRASAAIAQLRAMKHKESTLVHHDDADGLCSAAITKTALEREGLHVQTFCLEKTYSEFIDDLHRRKNEAIIYSDIGSAHADFISSVNARNNLTIILDHHHDPPEVTDARVFDLNLERFGFEGDIEFSGSTCSYLFAKILNNRNIDLSYLAVVGSLEIPSDFAGLNKNVLEEAIENGVVQVEDKKIRISKLDLSVDNLFSKLQIMGAVGYYEDGPRLGIQACLGEVTEQIKAKVKEWEQKRKNVNKRLLGWLYRQRLKEMGHLQWFDAGDMYKGMGTKVIGQFCSFLSYQARLVKPDKYIFGFMNVPSIVPGWQGRLKGPLVKVSVRVPRVLHELIDEGEARSAVDLLVKASDGFGMADGHKYAANVVIPAGKKEVLLRNAAILAVL